MRMDGEKQEFCVRNNCRVCCENHSNMCKIFEDGNKYRDMLQECCRIEIEEDDGLPEVICPSCVDEMIQAHKFIIKCLNSDKKLRMAVSSEVKEEEPCNYDDNLAENEIKIYYDDDDVYDDSSHRMDVYIKQESEDSKVTSSKKSSKKRKKDSREKSKYCKNYDFPKKCVECDYVAKSKSVMIIHTRTHTNEKPFLCNLCGKSFKVKDGLKAHTLRTHSKDKTVMSYQCHTCEKYFYRKRDLVVHIRIHTGETPYVCNLCPKKFSQITSLIRHNRVHTGDKPFKCITCSKSFSCSSGLAKHRDVHIVERKFSCTVCESSFKSKSALVQHATVHTNPNEVVCHQCGMCFNKRGNLSTHVKRMHSQNAGECPFCKKEFSQLKEHMIIHTSEKPFECDLCNRKFNRKISLNLHLRKHGVGKHFVCQVENCSKTFPMHNMLIFHELKYHKKQTPFMCTHCNKGFFRQCDLKKHLRVYHVDLLDVKETEDATAM